MMSSKKMKNISPERTNVLKKMLSIRQTGFARKEIQTTDKAAACEEQTADVSALPCCGAFKHRHRACMLCLSIPFMQEPLFTIYLDKTDRAGCNTTPIAHVRRWECAPAGSIPDTVCAS